MSKKLEFIVARSGVRLDRYVAEECPELSRSYVQKLISDGCITVNDRAAKGSLKLHIGDKITAVIPPLAPSLPLPESTKTATSWWWISQRVWRFILPLVIPATH